MTELNPSLPLLLVDDEPSWLKSLTFWLKFTAGYNNLLQCTDSRAVEGMLEDVNVMAILLDLNMPHLSGEKLLARLKQSHPDIPIVILSGMNQLETAVNCIKLGAFDYFVKSQEKEKLLITIKRALEIRTLQQENRQLKSKLIDDLSYDQDAFAAMVTRDEKMLSIFRYVEAVAHSSEPILISGESGSGKELIARAVHNIRCPQAPWVALNVAGLDDNMFSDTLFGHQKGAFTGADRCRSGLIEKATGGILFLDEIGDLTLPSQVKLLRFLQEGEYYPVGGDQAKRVDTQVIMATNHNLPKMVEQGAFRRDLYYRICAHQIELPPLKERKDDLPLLLDQFLHEAAQAFNKTAPTYPKELLTLLRNCHFPGNAREFRAIVFNAVSTHEGKILSMEPFNKALHGNIESQSSSATDESSATLFSSVEQLPTISAATEQLVREALERAAGNQSLAGKLLGISRQALAKRLKNMEDSVKDE